MSLIRRGAESGRGGCDFILELPDSRVGSDIVLLQLTDTQIIDESQTRTLDRLRGDERRTWSRENVRVHCYDHIRSLVAQSKPDMIFFTGDVVYGSFDDSGEILAEFVAFMDSLRIPWSVTFGNHDNESAIGVERQCELLSGAEYGMFARGGVSGNSNYAVGISVGGRMKRVLYFLDTHGCLRPQGILPDQIAWLRRVGRAAGESAPGFLAFHIPVDGFQRADYAAGYAQDGKPNFYIGVDVPARDGDFGFHQEAAKYIPTDDSFADAMRECRVDGVFVGHCHKIAASVQHEGVRWVFGLKTGQYDYHMEGQLGGTVITLNGRDDGFSVHYLPVLLPLGPFPAKGPVYTRDFLLD